MRSFGQVGSARNAALLARKVSSQTRAGAEDRLRFGTQNRQKLAYSDGFSKVRSAKFAPHCGDSEVKTVNKLKVSEGFTYNIQFRKICATLKRESNLEVKIVKTQGSRNTFFGFKNVFHVARARSHNVILRPSVWSICHFSGKSGSKAAVSESVN